MAKTPFDLPLGERGSKTKDKILDTAARLIADQPGGAADVNITDVAREAEITPALVHTYFGQGKKGSAKDFILSSIYGLFIGQAAQMMDMALRFGNAKTPVEELVLILDATIRIFEQAPAFGKVVLKETKELSRKRDEIKPILRIFDRLDEIVRAGQEANQLDPRLEAWIIRQCLFGKIHTVLSIRYLAAGRPPGAQQELTSALMRKLALRELQCFTVDKLAREYLSIEIERDNAS